MIDVMSASKDELIEYARNDLGLNLRANASLATLRVKVADAMGIELPEEEPASGPAVKHDKPTTLKINIHPTAGKSGRQDVFVGVNDKTYLIKRGIDVRVPVEVVEVLKNAVEDVFEYDEEAKDVVKRQTLSYPFTVVPDY